MVDLPTQHSNNQLSSSVLPDSRRKRVLLIIIVAAFLLILFLLSQLLTSENPTTSTPRPTRTETTSVPTPTFSFTTQVTSYPTTPVATIDTRGWRTYTDTVHGITFMYPAALLGENGKILNPGKEETWIGPFIQLQYIEDLDPLSGCPKGCTRTKQDILIKYTPVTFAETTFKVDNQITDHYYMYRYKADERRFFTLTFNTLKTPMKSFFGKSPLTEQEVYDVFNTIAYSVQILPR